MHSQFHTAGQKRLRSRGLYVLVPRSQIVWIVLFRTTLEHVGQCQLLLVGTVVTRFSNTIKSTMRNEPSGWTLWAKSGKNRDIIPSELLWWPRSDSELSEVWWLDFFYHLFRNFCKGMHGRKSDKISVNSSCMVLSFQWGLQPTHQYSIQLEASLRR